MGAQNFNFYPKFSQHGRFLALNFAFVDEHFQTKNVAQTNQNLRPLLHPHHDATICKV